MVKLWIYKKEIDIMICMYIFVRSRQPKWVGNGGGGGGEWKCKVSEWMGKFPIPITPHPHPHGAATAVSLPATDKYIPTTQVINLLFLYKYKVKIIVLTLLSTSDGTSISPSLLHPSLRLSYTYSLRQNITPDKHLLTALYYIWLATNVMFRLSTFVYLPFAICAL